MGQSLVKNYIHLVWTTKNCEPLLEEWVQPDLYAYMGKICNDLECYPVKIGGYLEHIHVLCLLSKKIALMDLLMKLKANSSRWLKDKSDALIDFDWQDGYAGFSVSMDRVENVVKYITN